jgi:predicted AAA+ superfamily ATPase
VHEVREMRLLLELLRSRTGSPLSFSALAEDLQVAPNTVKKYVSILESLYIIFLIRPFHRRIERAIIREPKVYFYDSGFVKGDEGRRLENTCAQALLKHVHFLHDVRGKSIELHYLRTKDGREIDFAIAEDEKLTLLAEIKLGEETPSPHFAHFRSRGVDAPAVQIVKSLRRESRRDGIAIVLAADWLAGLEA